jgi:branched-subunit amino acid transport protein AzlD
MSGNPYTHQLAPQLPRGWEWFYRVENLAALGLAGLATYLAATESLNWVPFVLGGAAVLVILFVDWPYAAFLELCLAASTPRWFFKIGKLHAKPEHFVAAVIGVFLFSRILAQKHKWKSAGKPELVLLAFLAMNYFTSLTTSPDRASTFRWAVLLTLAASPYFLLWQVVRTREDLDRFMDRWLSVGVLGALFGILCFFSFVAFHTEIGVSVFDFLGFIPAVHGAQWEPNIFGSYCASFSAMFLFYFLNCTSKKGWYLAGFLITTMALLLSLARQGWLSLIVVGAWILFYTLRKTKFRVKHLAPVLASVILAFIVGFAVMGNLSDRLASLSLDTAEDDPTVVRRAGMMALASQDIQAHPMLGLGTSSFQLLYIADSDTTYQGVDNAWLGSYFFGIVHDTGMIGMIVFLWFLISLGRRAWRVLAAPARGPTTTAVGALCAAVMVMLIAYQFTDASTLAFTWIHYGMLAAALRIAELPDEKT